MRALSPALLPAAAALLGTLALLLGGCAAPADDDADGGGAPPVASTPRDEPVGPGPKEFVVNVTEDGFNAMRGLTLTVHAGDQVRILLYHREPYNDYHPIHLSCYEVTASVTPGDEPALLEFTATEAGTCAFYCLNHDCNIHDKLQDGQLVVEG